MRFKIASPQTSFGVGFVCHAFISPPNECVTNEPQRTSAGRLRHDDDDDKYNFFVSTDQPCSSLQRNNRAIYTRKNKTRLT